ncbi:MAG: signal peptide peptidase SppA [Firmicutes bacterium]|nr:signal peptide peptidase SppA [Bacillota bacterium]
MDNFENVNAANTEEKGRTVVLENKPKKKMKGWQKGLLILALIVVCIIGLVTGCSKTFSNLDLGGGDDAAAVDTDFGHAYIGSLYVEGEIDEYGTGTYNHQYLLNAIDAMINDEENRGMILHVNTPGGSVFASDELYFAIREYQETTGRPVYSAMQSQATSGGYYISAPCDKILANRNCWTGSIGVTMGSLMDISELLENLGIRVDTITAGSNKAMGSGMEPMTHEQRAIFQSLVDEAYEQFVELVAEGRDMSVAEVTKLADGRIYTAKQALENGLIDGIATYEEAIRIMKEECELTDCEVEEFIPEVSTDLYSLLGIMAEQKGVSGMTDAQMIEELVAMNGTFRVSYISDIRK